MIDWSYSKICGKKLQNCPRRQCSGKPPFSALLDFRRFFTISQWCSRVCREIGIPVKFRRSHPTHFKNFGVLLTRKYRLSSLEEATHPWVQKKKNSWIFEKTFFQIWLAVLVPVSTPAPLRQLRFWFSKLFKAHRWPLIFLFSQLFCDGLQEILTWTVSLITYQYFSYSNHRSLAQSGCGFYHLLKHRYKKLVTDKSKDNAKIRNKSLIFPKSLWLPFGTIAPFPRFVSQEWSHHIMCPLDQAEIIFYGKM